MKIYNTAVAIGTEMSTNSTILVSGGGGGHNFFTFRPVVIIIKENCLGLVRAMKSNQRNQHSYSLKPYLKLFAVYFSPNSPVKLYGSLRFYIPDQTRVSC